MAKYDIINITFSSKSEKEHKEEIGMKMRNGCVMRLKLWNRLKEGSKDFLPFIEITKEDRAKYHLMFGYVIAELSAGKGNIQWIEDGKFFRISTLEEAQELFEMKKKTKEAERSKFSFRRHKKEETPVALTLVRCERLGYALWNKEKGEVEMYFIMTTKPEKYPKYAQLVAGTELFARGMTVITQ